MKQTATEFLFEKLWDSPKDKLTWNAILEQAKEMEKEQIKHAWNDGSFGVMEFTMTNENSEQYYNNTYDK
jgi:hypothetical protein